MRRTRINSENCLQIGSLLSARRAEDELGYTEQGIRTLAIKWLVLTKFLKQWDENFEETDDIHDLPKVITFLEGVLPETEPQGHIINLEVGKSIVACALTSVLYLRLWQIGAISWEECKDNLLKKGISDISPNGSDPEFPEEYLEWLEEQKENNLPNNSSGSFMYALKDWDNLFPENYEFSTEQVKDEVYQIWRDNVKNLNLR